MRLAGIVWTRRGWRTRVVALKAYVLPPQQLLGRGGVVVTGGQGSGRLHGGESVVGRGARKQPPGGEQPRDGCCGHGCRKGASNWLLQGQEAHFRE